MKFTLCAGYRQTNKAFLTAQRLLTLGPLSATYSGMHNWFERVLKTTLTLVLGAYLLGGSLHAENDEPFIYATEVSGEDVVVSVHVPSGYQSAVLEISNDVNAGWQPIVAGTCLLYTSPSPRDRG